ncbi:hypothetical protein C5167_044998 [Papaver somniferum]|uniref:Uncharacterized protein n=1 Tax=Papaver somniferum TaxID=3469 RepID=A0A4Y7LCF5_PAPSO|nr:subtilisin-like protease SBT1.7 [Papaver somniferum]RZC82208.1 hypothetical protein C5167_044998 [Papaver somniferum]
MKLLIVLTLFCFLGNAFSNDAIPTTKHYIVYMGDHSQMNSQSVISSRHDMLASVTGSVHLAKEAVVHHYSKSFRGFSAMLTEEQAQQLSTKESVISVFESKTNRLHTTHSWEFLGVEGSSQHNKPTTGYEYDVIVGVIDSGVWPESESFNDEGLGPVPKRFKGECIVADHFTHKNCNRKIIGARFYSKGYEAENGPLESFNATFFRSPRDSDGHGTHTASTVAGSVVNNVSLFGMASGTARGGMPSARLAIYKACWFGFCSDADLLLAFDDAIHDGVDIISLSLGPDFPQPSFFTDVNSIGSFHALQKGILVSASAGNAGLPSTATNVAPWILTVAASSIDRDLFSNVYLGNSKILQGTSLNPLKMDKYYGIISATSAAATGVPPENASFCTKNTLDHELIKGKIVVCTIETATDNRREKGIAVRDGGGVGMILIDPLLIDVGFQFVIPAALFGQNEALVLQEYLSTEKYPTGKIIPTTTVFKTSPAPAMAVFSSMGLNVITPDILKPDITAPGVNILAAWSPVATDGAGGRSVDYNIISGTSMSCPHISAVAAVIKSCHPSWSPAAIKSAIMTTASVMNSTLKPILRDPIGSPTTPFDFGCGHVNPVAALDPGLIYDYGSNDILNFLCGAGATPAEIRNFTGAPFHCNPIPSYDLNYPSIGVSNMNGSVSVLRTVTYYGYGPTVFKPFVESPSGVKVTVTPHKLKFKETGEKMSFRVRFMPYKSSNGSFVFGSITWSDGIYHVRSPIGLNVISV